MPLNIIVLHGFIAIIMIVIVVFVAEYIKQKHKNKEKAYEIFCKKLWGLFIAFFISVIVIIGLLFIISFFVPSYTEIVKGKTTTYELKPIVNDDIYALSTGKEAYFLYNGIVISSRDFNIVYDTDKPYLEKSKIKKNYYLNVKGPRILLESDTDEKLFFYTLHLTDISNTQKLNTQ